MFSGSSTPLRQRRRQRRIPRLTHNVAVVHVQRMLRVVGTGITFSGPPSWKLADSCILTAWSACCSSAESSTPIQGRVPVACRAAMLPLLPPCPRPGCTPGGHQRLLALHLDPSALARALPAEHGTGSVVCMVLLPCGWGETATAPRALPAIRSFRNNFSRQH